MNTATPQYDTNPALICPLTNPHGFTARQRAIEKLTWKIGNQKVRATYAKTTPLAEGSPQDILQQAEGMQKVLEILMTPERDYNPKFVGLMMGTIGALKGVTDNSELCNNIRGIAQAVGIYRGYKAQELQELIKQSLA